uniref:Uncharacterized protein n=1 Tax=Oryza barthii TaxID=65489 RepID=A0A0D3GZW6_9ORYZ
MSSPATPWLTTWKSPADSAADLTWETTWPRSTSTLARSMTGRGSGWWRKKSRRRSVPEKVAI